MDEGIRFSRTVRAIEETPVNIFRTLTIVEHMDTGQLYVKKSTSAASPIYYERAKMEIEFNLKLLETRNILPMRYFVVTPHSVDIYTDYWQDGDLRDFSLTNKITPRDALRIVYVLAKALHVLHSEFHIAHRDVKMENVLTRSSLSRDLKCDVALFDFGLSAQVDSLRSSRVGSILYSAPELWGHGKTAEPTLYDAYKLDVWSLGVLFYAMFTRKYPFDSRDNVELARMIVEDDLSWPTEPKPPTRIRRIIECMLCKDPTQRITMEEFLTCSDVVASIPTDMQWQPKKPPTPPLDLSVIVPDIVCPSPERGYESDALSSPSPVGTPEVVVPPHEEEMRTAGETVRHSWFQGKKLSARTAKETIRELLERRKRRGSPRTASDDSYSKKDKEVESATD